MLNEVALYNMALDAISVKGTLSSVEDRKREAEVCRLHYPQARDAAQGMAYWPSLRNVEYLPLLKEREVGNWNANQPSPSWRYAYALPNGCLRPRYIEGFHYFQLEQYKSQRALMTNASNAILVYTKTSNDPGEWERELVDMVVTQLAARIAFTMTGKQQIRNDQVTLARQAYEEGVASVGNSEYIPMLDHVPPEIVARNGLVIDQYSTQPRRDTAPFIYPLGGFVA